jgi:hypothetical protein
VELTTAEERRSKRFQNRLRRWFFEGMRETGKPVKTKTHKDDWFNVMCLTGVDYFSTLGYQPGIAFLAAGLLSPLATIILVLLTLFGALPVYLRVAKESPHGQGSIAMLEHLLPGWRGKAFVLCLLGFAATSFIITITLSAADATAHIVENPLMPHWLDNRIGITFLLLAILGGVFLLGFREAIGVSVFLVWSYLILNAVVLFKGFSVISQQPDPMSDFFSKLSAQYTSPWVMLGLSLMLFPKLALGLSGFETGVAVMPLVKGDPDDDAERPSGAIRNTRALLITAAGIMSVFLILSSIVTTLLIPPADFQEGGAANGRALAYLAHKYFGEMFGTAYDVSTIFILWFAGASAIVGLLNLLPRYLPRYGMAPEWARALRPLVLVISAVCFVVTVIFKADVDAQAGAYATGVLMLITSAAVAVTLTSWRENGLHKYFYAAVMVIFIYTTGVNMWQRPEGLQIAIFFIAAMTATSLFSRAMRSIELRIGTVKLDAVAEQLIHKAQQSGTGDVRLLAHRPGGSDYAAKERESRETHSIQMPEGEFVFLEIELDDASDFHDDVLEVWGEEVGGYKVLKCKSPAIPNAIAALLLYLRDKTGKIPHAYFGWTEGNPLGYIFKYIFFGEGETAPVCREILRQVEPDPAKRPRIHVG